MRHGLPQQFHCAEMIRSQWTTHPPRLREPAVVLVPSDPDIVGSSTQDDIRTVDTLHRFVNVKEVYRPYHPTSTHQFEKCCRCFLIPNEHCEIAFRCRPLPGQNLTSKFLISAEYNKLCSPITNYSTANESSFISSCVFTVHASSRRHILFHRHLTFPTLAFQSSSIVTRSLTAPQRA